MTLDAAEIDLGDAFEPGMGYVALSRVRCLNGLKLMNLNDVALTVHPKILQQDHLFKENSEKSMIYFNALSPEEKIDAQRKTLIERFGGNQEKSTQKNVVKKSKVPTHITTHALLKENKSLSDIAKIRGLTLSTIIAHIEKLKKLKQLDAALMEHLKKEIPPEDFDLILSAFKKSEDGKLTPIYDAF